MSRQKGCRAQSSPTPKDRREPQPLSLTPVGPTWTETEEIPGPWESVAQKSRSTEGMQDLLTATSCPSSALGRFSHEESGDFQEAQPSETTAGSPVSTSSATPTGNAGEQSVSPLHAQTPRMQSPMSAYFNPAPRRDRQLEQMANPVAALNMGQYSSPQSQYKDAQRITTISHTAPWQDGVHSVTEDAANPLVLNSSEVVAPLPTDGGLPWLQPEGTVSNSPWHLPCRYQLGAILGAGAYGSVCEAWDHEEQRKVAIKRIDQVYQDAVHCKRILREVAILSHLRHPNVVRIYDLPKPVQVDKFDVLYFIMERCDTDLRKLCHNSAGVSLEQARKLAYGLLKGCKYLHAAGIYHRDLKPANCLVNRDCSVKICDFNLAVSVGSLKRQEERSRKRGSKHQLRRSLTAHVATRWYRPPEVLLQLEYSEKMDVWSAGCIIAEVFQLISHDGEHKQRRGAIFPGNRDAFLSACSENAKDDNLGDQLSVIIDALGPPSGEDVMTLPVHAQARLFQYPPRMGRGLRSRLPAQVGGEGLDLLERMLRFMPADRITMAEAVEHTFMEPLHSQVPAEDTDVGNIDIGFDEEELDRNFPMIPRTLAHEIDIFKPSR